MTTVSTVDNSPEPDFRPRDQSGQLMPVNLAASAVWRSRWYPRSTARPRVLVHFVGDASATLSIEESFDQGTTIHNIYSQATGAKTFSSGATRQVASIDARIIAPYYRVVVQNGATAQTIAQTFFLVSSQ
jgi:hypothetical protein